MKRQDFYFELPEELIAQYPLPNRSDSRLLAYERQKGTIAHLGFSAITDLLEPGDLLVMNNSMVIPARLYGQKVSGGKVELLVERLIGEDCFLAHIKASKPPKAGSIVTLQDKWQLEVLSRDDDLFHCKVNGKAEEMLEQIGHIPLPPYISRQDEMLDKSRYQTVYAQHKGSVAAPTAGLHFDDQLLGVLKNKGIKIGFSTLHVGAGTFRPVRSIEIKDHKMHREYFSVAPELCDLVNQTKAKKKRVIAVGTTALRSLESAAENGILYPASRDTDIFIYPGYQFQICDGLITNFHLPESTLLMLVSAFIGYKETMNLYRIAVEERYRFFSYGDACLLL
ncbi:tRNA preQ1(34) S-adenosylmethionine ribosyltransferase-isomerase QueA [Legionella londiniensis]|uniref:S-adenosylmethionine:tRNA ribosyltransferase-isomerase n=1 Tax=Legionella londiniensis TaxID=45068 RepID=A0A0W0VNU3_9GAMM|nr:tRNA preQ1(34) S-adenosylmethionine ribosyltransferase-isomerase QueA [Legionella londiniensis]KTD21842.1 S-adenosylmethionine:tRNA ribosyltransferase-isomerase [Legionella londiniensis]STX92675.1 S-adenosylmethionine:tRNA ribosyltransferase-isomerase [Legionella londiniensis]